MLVLCLPLPTPFLLASRLGRGKRRRNGSIVYLEMMQPMWLVQFYRMLLDCLSPYLDKYSWNCARSKCVVEKLKQKINITLIITELRLDSRPRIWMSSMYCDMANVLSNMILKATKLQSSRESSWPVLIFAL